MSGVDREKLIVAIDEMHERAWSWGEKGYLHDRRAADSLAAALGWRGEHGTTPDGPWLRERLSEVLR